MRAAPPRFAVPCPTRGTTGTIAAMALYAGESVDAVSGVVPAADIVHELVDGAERLLSHWSTAKETRSAIRHVLELARHARLEVVEVVAVEEPLPRVVGA